MKIALFTLTKDRFGYTKRTFESLSKKTHTPYDHFVIDQGSKDKTVEWLSKFSHQLGKVYVYSLGQNIGINRGVNFAVDHIGNKYDVIVKIDNDAQIKTDGWLEKCLRVLDKKMLISPYVQGLIENRGGVDRIGFDEHNNIGITPFIGGFCMIGFKEAWSKDSGGWEYPVPKHSGGDKAFCMKLALAGYGFGYVENVIIKHIETTAGQHERYPEYFRKRRAERVKVF